MGAFRMDEWTFKKSRKTREKPNYVFERRMRARTYQNLTLRYTPTYTYTGQNTHHANKASVRAASTYAVRCRASYWSSLRRKTDRKEKLFTPREGNVQGVKSVEFWPPWTTAPTYVRTTTGHRYSYYFLQRKCNTYSSSTDTIVQLNS